MTRALRQNGHLFCVGRLCATSQYEPFGLVSRNCGGVVRLSIL